MPIAQFIGISCKYSVVFDLQHLCFNLQNLFLTFKMSHTRGERKMGEKSPFRVATREELLAKGYVLSLAELNLPASPELTEIISVLQTQRGPVALAIWFQSANGWLGSARPMDVVRRISPGEMSDVLHAARREIAPIEHG
ncbi:hypothetical protein [Aeromonas hydrophila]|uniref:hypothetical protein n=1 Tax=Aeromonas hydrophila TaxID=644 RepID=UPI003F7ABC4A